MKQQAAAIVLPLAVSGKLILAQFQQLESVRPLVTGKARYTPQNAQRFYGTRGLGHAHILSLPAKVSQDVGYRLLGGSIVAGNEHTGRPTGELRVHHEGATYAGEGLHKPSLRNRLLQAFQQALVQVGEEL
jgi:hypothetical protein